MTRDLSPFRVNTHELPRRAGEMKEYSIDFDLTEAFGVELISVPPGEVIEVDLPQSIIVDQDEIPGTGRAVELAVAALPAGFATPWASANPRQAATSRCAKTTLARG